MILSCTGHRPHVLDNDYEYVKPISKWVSAEIRKVLIDKKPEKILGGMAVGADTLFALVGLELGIPLLACVPFEGQEKKWPKFSQDLFYKILENPLTTQHVVCPGGYSGWKFIARDKYMVDNSDELLAVYNGDLGGGTYQTYRYALEKGKPITRIDPRDFVVEKN